MEPGDEGKQESSGGWKVSSAGYLCKRKVLPPGPGLTWATVEGWETKLEILLSNGPALPHLSQNWLWGEKLLSLHQIISSFGVTKIQVNLNSRLWLRENRESSGEIKTLKNRKWLDPVINRRITTLFSIAECFLKYFCWDECIEWIDIVRWEYPTLLKNFYIEVHTRKRTNLSVKLDDFRHVYTLM